MIANHELFPFARGLDLPVLDHFPVMIPEHREQHRIAQFRLRRVPLDVKVGGVTARRTVFQYIPPPWVVLAADRHVIGDNVEHLPKSALPQLRAHRGVSSGASQLFIHLSMVDDIVTVRASRRRLQVRRCIEMADT